MCDVTRSNFQQLLPQILDHIERASWLSFDCEYTALRPGEPHTRLSDTPAGRHQQHVRARAASGGPAALICQFGLALFIEDATDPLSCILLDGLRFTAHVYNFYLCPRASGGAFVVDDATFVCQASSLDFLRSHGFDFGRWLGEGLGYLSREQDAAMRREAAEGTLFTSVMRGLALEEVEMIQHLCSQVWDLATQCTVYIKLLSGPVLRIGDIVLLTNRSGSDSGFGS
jgi:hypothetical protein